MFIKVQWSKSINYDDWQPGGVWHQLDLPEYHRIWQEAAETEEEACKRARLTLPRKRETRRHGVAL